ncbi:hypothetical protein FA13DRAFT_1742897 [Coprinellus micaceus]|uniref:Uncharacterized protein n=1 Tax=Coprinellus micaceus TaxID=71717 RepID=A0A4Y7SFM2_COPMI|nr:hypothetical protein FA13DRAFT_1742897 [Coprinellus micaceus]
MVKGHGRPKLAYLIDMSTDGRPGRSLTWGLSGCSIPCQSVRYATQTHPTLRITMLAKM